MSPQFVTPYRKGNKNDPNDAEAICETVTRPSLRFVPIKRDEEQDMQALQRVREQLIKTVPHRPTRSEVCCVSVELQLPRQFGRLRAALPLVLEDETNGLSALMRELVGEMAERLRTLDDYTRRRDQRIARLFQKDERWQRLVKVEGIEARRLRPPQLQRLVMPGSSNSAATSVRGWDWCYVNTAAVSVLSCWVSASAATAISAHYSFTHPRCPCGGACYSSANERAQPLDKSA